MPVITPELIAAGMSDAGGWNKAQLRAIGIPWPLTHGWQREALGRAITQEQHDAFLSLRGQTKSRARAARIANAEADLSQAERIALKHTAAMFGRLQPVEIQRVLKSLHELYGDLRVT